MMSIFGLLAIAGVVVLAVVIAVVVMMASGDKRDRE